MRQSVPLTLVLLLGLTPWAHATVVTLDFETDNNIFLEIIPYIEDGISITPNCSWSIFADDLAFQGSKYLQSTANECGGGVDGSFNPDWPGPEEFQVTNKTLSDFPAALWIEAGGHTFDLLDVWIPQSGFRLSSSRGGLFEAFAGFAAFNGPEWTDLDWVLYVSGGNHGDPGPGLDHLRVRVVPEPSSLLLLGLSLLTAVGFRRPRFRRRSS